MNYKYLATAGGDNEFLLIGNNLQKLKKACKEYQNSSFECYKNNCKVIEEFEELTKDYFEFYIDTFNQIDFDRMVKNYKFEYEIVK